MTLVLLLSKSPDGVGGSGWSLESPDGATSDKNGCVCLSELSLEEGVTAGELEEIGKVWVIHAGEMEVGDVALLEGGG